MKKFIFGALALTGFVSAHASLIPPHVQVVTSCGKVHAVYVVTDKNTQKYDTANSTQAAIDTLAEGAPHNSWVDAGCSH